MRATDRARIENSSTSLWRVTYGQRLTVGHAGRMDDAKMARERMTLSVLAKELRSLSARVEEGFARVGDRLETVESRLGSVEGRLDTMDNRLGTLESRFGIFEQGLDDRLDAFAKRIEERFRMLMEGVQRDFTGTTDLTKATDERIHRVERENAEEHRMMQAQIDDLDSRLPPRRGPRRRS